LKQQRFSLPNLFSSASVTSLSAFVSFLLLIRSDSAMRILFAFISVNYSLQPPYSGDLGRDGS
jgi:hypothetical protein